MPSDASSQPATYTREALLSLAGRLALDRVDRIPAETETLLLVTDEMRALGSGAALADWITDAGGNDPREDAFRELFLAFLEFAATRTAALEAGVTSLRRELLLRIANQTQGAPRYLEASAAVAVHCFYHEYVFAETAAETRAVELLLARSAQEPPSPTDIAIIGAYRPLRALAHARRLPGIFIGEDSQRLQRLLRLDILDWIQETKLASGLECLTPVGDAVSLAVRAQYEENPYPRWSYMSVDQPRDSNVGQGLKILIAGCGTGQHALNVAAAYPAADILALDLSLASLAYAARAAIAYGFRGLRFAQADILALDRVPGAFDIIVCEGVLHHLRDPEAGLAALLSRLKPGGKLKIAVYSNSGRRWFAPVAALRDRLNLAPTLDGIRALRAALFDLPDGDPAKFVTTRMDFYFTSMCRDLMFHVQEHRFDLPELARLFERHGLTVEELTVPAKARDIFHGYHPDADPARDLERWGAVEARHDYLFGSMYHVWLRA